MHSTLRGEIFKKNTLEYFWSWTVLLTFLLVDFLGHSPCGAERHAEENFDFIFLSFAFAWEVIVFRSSKSNRFSKSVDQKSEEKMSKILNKMPRKDQQISFQNSKLLMNFPTRIPSLPVLKNPTTRGSGSAGTGSRVSAMRVRVPVLGQKGRFVPAGTCTSGPGW